MSKIELTQSMRRSLRAQAHDLHPVVTIGDRGLTESVITEIERSLVAHELIKIRVAGEDRDAREAILQEICEKTDSNAIQHLGKVLIIYRKGEPKPGTGSKSEPYVPKKKAAAKKTALKGRNK